MNPTANTAPSTNGRPRRSLNDTIAKLDSMLDGLSAAIPETIRDELRADIGQAVTEGVRSALIEIFNSQQVQTMMHGMPAAPPVPAPMAPATPGLAYRAVDGTRQAVVTAAKWTAGVAAAAASGVADRSWRFGRWLKSLVPWINALRRPLIVGLCVGAGAAVVATVAPGWVGATLSGVCAACTAVAVQVGLWFRRMLGYSPQPE